MNSLAIIIIIFLNSFYLYSSSEYSFEGTSKFRELWSPHEAINLTLNWVKGQGHDMVPMERVVTRIMHAKYQSSIINNNTSENMSQVKVFVTDRRMDRWMSFYVPHFR